MEWTDEVRIETPEQIDVSLELAGLGSRFVAQVIDWAVKFGLILVFVVLVTFTMQILGISSASRIGEYMVAAVLVVLIYAFLLGCDIYWEVSSSGQTPGKRLAGIRVIREGGAPIDFTSACVRNILGMADCLPFFYLLGGFLVLLSPRGQRLGDMAAGTIVIRERSLAIPVQSQTEAERLATEEFHFTPQQISSYTPADRHILKSYFQRSGQMTPESRQQLAYRLASQFLGKTSYEPQPPLRQGPRAEVFLACLYRDLEDEARLSR
ncbi:MAG TPA: RDD family protein [Isosphaeraceae bacterium]|jgi:uncharacterized RDD family membrane protein YckC|nr:RDD family protein [Isosphaeraceae bacterium]